MLIEKANEIGRMIKKILISSMVIATLFLLAPGVSARLIAQTDEIVFEHISIEQGLSQSTVFCILQDRRGFMWFGTQHGLNRYDGYNFKVYDYDPRNPHSLSHNLVLSLYEDQSEILWVGTWGGGLNKFDPKTEKFSTYKNVPGDPTSLSNDNVNTIFEDESGALWVGTDEGLNKFSRESEKFTHYLEKHTNLAHPGSFRINAICQDKSGILLIGTDDGLYEYNRGKNDVTVLKCKNSDHYSMTQKMSAIYKDKNGVVWIGTEKGLYSFNRQDGKFSHIQALSAKLKDLNEKQIRSIHRDSSGILWIGTKRYGLLNFDPRKDEISHHVHIPGNPNSLNNNEVRAIYEDRTGLIWLGTNGGGLNKVEPKRKKFQLYRNNLNNPDSLSDNDVMVIRKSKFGYIWIGIRGGGVNKFEPKKNKFTHYKIQPYITTNSHRNDIRAICEDNSGILWIGTQRAGLYKFDPKEEKFYPYINDSIGKDEYILTIFEDRAGVLWIGSMGGGLTKIYKEKDLEKSENYKNISGHPDSLSSNQVFSIYEDKLGILWIGTGNGGLNKFDRKNNKFIRYVPSEKDPNSLSHNFITAIYEDKAGGFWVGTNGGGLNKFDRERKKFTTYKVKDGLPNNVVYDILEDDSGNLWLSTNKGLSKFNPKTSIFRNYTVRDGLQDYEFNRGAACKCSGKKIYFGGVNGVNVFEPGKLEATSSPPPIVITSFKKMNKIVALGKPIYYIQELELSYKDSLISFEFAALNFSDPEKNQYAYKLEPVNQDWINLGNNHEIILSNLEPEEYTLWVKGSNDEGVWNENGISIRINVKPPFWKAWWFWILIIVAVFETFFGIAKMRINIIRNKKDELSRANELLMQQMRERERAEEALEESERRYRTLIDTSPDAITLSDAGGKIIIANWEAAKLLGFSSVGNMITNAKSIFDYLDQKDRDRAQERIKIVLENGIDKAIEYTLITRDGTPIAAEISTSSIKDANGNPKYFLWITRDIRERKEIEKQEKLQREKLTQMDKMATVGTLVSGVAHELNNPVSSIKWNAEIFSRVWEDSLPVLNKYYEKNKGFTMASLPYEEAKLKLEELIIGFMESAQRIKEIVDNLKTFSRPDDSFATDAIDINSVIQSSVHLTNNILKSATEHFSLELAEDLPILEGNLQKLERVFINLIQNACQALPDRNKGIYISTEYNDVLNHIVIKIQDEGTGIKEKDLKHITDPFYTTKRDNGGTGLGLSISLQIIEDLGGDMNFQSTVGKGTTVTVNLPVNQS